LRLGAPLLAFLGSGPQGGGGSFVATVSAEFMVALVLAAPIAIPTTWLYLTLATRASSAGRATPDTASGAAKASAWNGVGCAIAPLFSSLWALPAVGTLGLAAAAILALAAVAAAMAVAPPGRARAVGSSPPPRADRARVMGVLALAIVPFFLVREGLYDWIVTPGWRLVWKQEGAGASVSVEESPDGLRRLRTNNNFTEGGDAGGVSQIRQGLLPTLLAPEARRVLLLGVGSGITLAGAVAGLPEGSFDAVELLPEIGRAVGMFGRTHGGIERHPRVKLHVADARSFAAHAAVRGERYDLVVGELFHAAQAGTGALYSREHFASVARLIGAGGLYCQWLPLHETPTAEVRTVVRTFFRVFPHGGAFLGGWNLRTAILGLVGTEKPLELDFGATQSRLRAPAERAARARSSEIDRLEETLATFVADADGMRAWAGPGRENTDDRPELELGAPRGYRDTLGPENLLALDPIRRPADAWVSYGEPSRKASVLAIQQAVGGLIRGVDAWSRRDLDRAEIELKTALTEAPTFAPPRSILRVLPEAWNMAGKPDRAAALATWLAALPR
jgi:spermidine synthase